MFRAAVRRFATSAIRRSEYEEGPGKNLPFSVEKKWNLLALFSLFSAGCSALTVLTTRSLIMKNT